MLHASEAAKQDIVLAASVYVCVCVCVCTVTKNYSSEIDAGIGRKMCYCAERSD